MLILLAAIPLPAQPVLTHVDTFHGVPFTRASRLASTADGAFLYASGGWAGVSAFRRGADGESWRYLASYFSDGSGDAIEWVVDLVLGPDDAHLYATSNLSDAVAVFSRHAGTGRLATVQTLVAGSPGMPAFSDPSWLALSPRGDFLYVAVLQPGAQRVLVLARDAGSGTLSFVQDFTPPAGSFSPAIAALLMSPDGEFLYSLGRPVISTFDRDPSSGRLSFVDARDRLEDENLQMVSSRSGAVSPDGANLYVRGTNPCYNSCRREGVAVLRRDPRSGRVEVVENVPYSIMISVGKLVLSPDGRHLYLTDNELGRTRISTLARQPGNGALELRGEIVSRNLGWDDVGALRFDASGEGLWASGFESRLLPRLQRDPATGALRYEERTDDAAEAITGAADVAVSPDGEHLYVAGYRSAAIATLAWDGAAGSLEPRTATFIPDLGSWELDAPFRLEVSPDGKRLYALDGLSSLMSFARGAGGGLELVATFTAGGDVGSVSSFEISPDHAHVYLVGFYGIAVVRREPMSGDAPAEELTLVEVFEGSGLRSLAASPDGSFLYALASTRDCGPDVACPALQVLARDPASGSLSWRDSVFHLGSRSFGSPRSLLLSPDGRHLYVSSFELGTSAVAVFSRDPDDGALELVEVSYGDDASEDVFYGTRDLTLAPDGRHLYFLTTPDRVLVVFARDPHTGRLTRLETWTADEVGALAEATGVAVSPDSQLVFVSGAERSAVTTFSRRCLTGASACAGGDRFRLDVAWRDYAGRIGAGRPLEPVSDDSRIFWFFDRDNWEMLVKVLAGCAINDRWWVFAAATTDVETRLTVTDTWTGQRRSYLNALGTASPAVTDTAAFATCGATPPAFR